MDYFFIIAGVLGLQILLIYSAKLYLSYYRKTHERICFNENEGRRVIADFNRFLNRKETLFIVSTFHDQTELSKILDASSDDENDLYPVLNQELNIYLRILDLGVMCYHHRLITRETYEVAFAERIKKISINKTLSDHIYRNRKCYEALEKGIRDVD